MEVNKSDGLVNSDIMQKIALNPIQTAKNRSSRVIDGRGSIFQEAEQVCFVQNNQIGISVITPGAQESSEFPSCCGHNL